MWSFLLGFGVAQRIVFCSLLWFASLGLSTGHGHTHRTHSRFLQPPEVYFRVPSGVDIHTSLASGFCVPASHLFPFLHLFPPLNVSVSPAHFRIACFLHIAPRLLFWFPRDRVCIKGVDEATYIKNKSSTQASAQPCVYGDLAVVQVARHSSPTSPTIRLPLLIYGFCVTRAGLLFLHLFVFLDLGTLVIFPLSPLLCFCPYLYVSPFWVDGFLIFFCPVFLVIHSVVRLFISFPADLPSFFALASFFLPCPTCINIDSDYRIASYPSLLCYNETFSLLTSFSLSDVYDAILVFRCINWT
jgi:hypothetical protein